MKRIILTVGIILTMAVALTTSVCGANKPAKPLVDFLIQPRNSVWQLYGYSPDTLRLYNIIAIMQHAQRNEAQLTSLRTEVAELRQTLKNLEALIKANAAAITTLTTSELKQTMKNLEVVVEANALTVTPLAAEPKDLEETRPGCDK